MDDRQLLEKQQVILKQKKKYTALLS